MFIIFWALEAGVIALICLAAFLLWLAGRKSDKTWLRRLSALPLGGIALLLLLTLGGFAWSVLFPPSPTRIWAATFGYEPPAGVGAIQNADDGFGDWEVEYLKFRATPAAMRSIASRGWQRSALAGFSGSNGDVPTWWTPRITGTTQSFTPKVRRETFASEEEILTYDPSTQTAYYFYRGID